MTRGPWLSAAERKRGVSYAELHHRLAEQYAPPSVLIDADPVRIEQVVWNLLTNALKFTPAGGRVDVALSVAHGLAELQVRDSGRGIAPEALPHVFGMFKQADPGARRQSGLGIGLALVHSLVLGHGGQVLAESAGLEQGACFTVRLPLAGHAALDDGLDTGAEGQLLGRRALVVEPPPRPPSCCANCWRWRARRCAPPPTPPTPWHGPERRRRTSSSPTSPCPAWTASNCCTPCANARGCARCP